MKISQDQKWMTRALDLALKGRATVSPNPMVGACIVRRNRLISQGYHEYFGGLHAEAHALRRAGSKARGATLYVTLEPCSSWAKTPPCVEGILRAGIRRVVVAVRDPNPQNAGRGIRRLKREGIEVVTGILEREAKVQNEAFFKYMRTGLPFVTLKMAQSLDGKIASRTGSSRWISSPGARHFVHQLRAEQDAVLVGKNTFLIDDPFLSPRIKIKKKQPDKPWRVAVLDHAKALPKARIFQGKQLTLLAVSEKAAKKYAHPNGKKFSRTLLSVREKRGKLDFEDLIRKLGQLGIAKLLVEGGGETAASFLNAGLVDRLYWVIAPKIVGGRQTKTSVEGEGIRDLAKAIRVRSWHVSSLGNDLLIEGVV